MRVGERRNYVVLSYAWYACTAQTDDCEGAMMMLHPRRNGSVLDALRSVLHVMSAVSKVRCGSKVIDVGATNSLTLKKPKNASPRLTKEDTIFPEPCWNVKSRIPTHTINEAPVFQSDSFVPKCDDSGLYSPIQCHGYECWCVTPCGIEIPDTRTDSWPSCPNEMMTPPCTRQLDIWTDYMPDCDKNGYYKHKQCVGEECWCVNKCGVEVEGTRINGNPKCKAVFYLSEEDDTTGRTLSRTSSNMCTDGSQPEICDNSICDKMTCPGFHDAKCKVNRCKGCTVEFFIKEKKVVCRDTKIGSCPAVEQVKYMFGDRCDSECQSDTDCRGALKCCSNNCGTLCVPPKMDNHGSCPVPISIQDKTCSNKCNIDRDCSHYEKCCTNGCGKVCVSSKPREKPGMCPAVTNFPVTTCDIDCTNDNDCVGTKKCCQTTCGTVCVAAEFEDTTSTSRNIEKVCPAVSSDTFGTCVNNCVEDGECELGEKCCSNGCGTHCIKAVDPATPPCWTEKDHVPTTTFGGVSLPVYGHHVPTCDSEGFHTPKQCNPSTGICWCVDRCGSTIDGTQTMDDLTCEPKMTPCHDKKKQLRGSAPGLLGRHRVECTEEGLYEKRQCHGSTCWCTDRCGNEVAGTRGHITTVSCECRKGERAWNCARNPCDGVTCTAYPEAICKPNMCDGCKAEFWMNEEKVDCEIKKQGVCPLSTDMPLTCVSECVKDGDCSGTRKCCNNGCASVCVSPRPQEKHGNCPAITLDTIGSCTVECINDYNCHGNSKCCFNGCGKTCTLPTTTTNSRTCPVPWESCTVNEKRNECRLDEECTADRKCCETGCGMRCTTTTTTAHTTKTMKYGTCPAPSFLKCEYANECITDAECVENHKCCSNGCGRVCTPPKTMEKYGRCPHNVVNSETCNSETIINHECSVDDQCTGSKKCCMQGCNRVCVDVWNTVKVGECPAWTDNDFDTCITEYQCNTDNDCNTGSKCCNSPCGGMVCRNPTSTETCEYNGVTHIHGDIWQPDTCTTCKCLTGQTKCTQIACPKLEYDCVPTPVEGQCCPTLNCEKTKYEFLRCESVDGTSHMHGETWYPDSCSKCECHDGKILCSTFTCSSEVTVNTPGCKIVEVPDRCCPEVVCEDRCIDHEGHYRYENDIWYSDSCTQCMCRNNEVTCTKETCHNINDSNFPEGCHYEEVRGQCCPNVICPSEIEDRDSSCHDDGKTYGHGSAWMQSSCNYCMCRNGEMICRSTDCPQFENPILRGCTQMYVDGKCCPEIVCNKEPTCSHNGETHYHGESWHPDTCSTCTCDQGVTNCLVTNCQEPGPGCTARFVENQCCPEITCQTYHHVPMCNSSGIWHTNGETWLESDCDICTCHNGLTTCTSIECPMLTQTPGCHIVYEEGQCCPVKICRGTKDMCARGDIRHSDGETYSIHTNTNIEDLHTWNRKMISTGCATCTCMKGRISCMENVCPEVRPDCRVVENERDNECACPTIVCPEKKSGVCPIPNVHNVRTCDNECDADTHCTDDHKCCFNGCGMTCTKPVIEGCFDVFGVLRSHGDIWHKSDCSICECVNDQSICTESKCPEVPSHCTVRPVDGQCCGELVCENTYPATSCSHGNKVYPVDSTWVVDSCTTCSCIDGVTVCDSVTCPTTNVPGCRPSYVKGKCCPEKICKEPDSCDVNGEVHLNGEVWYLNECNRCHCVKGKYYCTETKCPVPQEGCQYDMTRTVNKQCCKNITCTTSSSEKTCEYMGEMKNSGEVWKKDSCTVCECDEGKTMCTVNTCPKMSVRPGCHAVKVNGQCCPEIVCRNMHSCMIDGVEHRNGEQWMHDNCTICRCELGHKYCTTKTCAEPSNYCAYSTQVTPGTCCPPVLCPFETSTRMCRENVGDVMKNFKHGETWMRDSCSQCTCHHGTALCQDQTCPMSVSPGCRTVPVDGQCCPNIVCDTVKIGQCPVVNPFMSKSITVDTCMSDTDCSGTTKCCSNGIAFTCMAPWTVEKPGMCPQTNPLTTPLRNMCVTECTNDMDCVNEWKCCSEGGCSMICRPPVTMTNTKTRNFENMKEPMTRKVSMLTGTYKSGECPNISPYGWNSGVCVSHCTLDIDCPGDNKCCSNGCGAMCMPPKNPTKFGMCPFNQPRGVCKRVINTCTEDSDCIGNKKCCNNGCGLKCVVPDVDTTICTSVPATCTEKCLEGYATNDKGCEICKCKKTPEMCGTEVMCDLFCQYGFATDNRGCEICKCKEPTMPTMNMMSPEISSLFCKPITRETCSVKCNHGYMTDSIGCELCACQKPETECTPLTACAQYCPYGYATNTDGCKMCMCKQPTISFLPTGLCTPLTTETCDKTCSNGYATNEIGCAVCKCMRAESECVRMESCNIRCPFGYATDDTRCKICKCKLPTMCPPVNSENCNEECTYGYITDKFGCEICSCKSPEMGCNVDESTEMIRMKETCAFGLCTDANGCDENKCKMPSTCTAVTPMTCKLNCLYGMATDKYGCETCMCKKPVTQCSPISNDMCTNFCPFGLATDSVGCEICRCKQPNIMMQMTSMDKALTMPTTPLCMPVTCELQCRNGLATDMLGCETCACKKQDAECPVVLDNINCPLKDVCPYDLATNINGCEICQCKQPINCEPMSALTCPETCVNGYATDERGCEICECKKPILECSPMTLMTCAKTCTYGYATNERRCEICMCKQPTTTAVTIMNTPVCEAVRCRMFCQEGWATDSYGCDTCKCKKAVNECPVITEEMCPMKKQCPRGLATNEDGCEICKCKLPVVCLPMDESACTETCRNGFATDTSGCEICKCKKIPTAVSKNLRNSDLVCPPTSSETFGICLTTCSRDSECESDEMCCSNGCGRMCTKSVRADSLCKLVDKETCKLDCTHGFATDYDGCEICMCKSLPYITYNVIKMTPSPMCRPVTKETCAKTCNHGYATDDMGCEVCVCRIPDIDCPVVNEVTCPLKHTSPYGLATDHNGCDICMQRQPIMCTPNTCSTHCVDGYATNDKGCEICECKKPAIICQTVTTKNCPNMAYCPNGLATNPSRCEICKCKMPEVTTLLSMETSMTSSNKKIISYKPETVTCQKVTPLSCRKTCHYGYATDTQGCEVCECKQKVSDCSTVHESSCPEKNHCSYGLKTNVDGCEICECKQPVMCTRLSMNTCKLTCKYGYATDIDGCEKCECKKSPMECTPINPLTCRKTCQLGLATDLNNCEMCKCKQPTVIVNMNSTNPLHTTSSVNKMFGVMASHWIPSVTCSPLTSMTCTKTCPNGYTTDTVGCDICECRKSKTECPVMKREVCPLVDRCEFGLMTNTEGCMICKCKQPSLCNIMNMKMKKTDCIYGYATDENGCETNECKKPLHECSSMTCDLKCTHGYATDMTRCNVCKCKQPKTPVDFLTYFPTTYSTPKMLPTTNMDIPYMRIFEELCHPVNPTTCTLKCVNGYATDRTGCEICKCKKTEAECPELSIHICSKKSTCSYDLATDENGCEICACKKPVTCPPVNHYTCPKVCHYGYATDHTGCSICQCVSTSSKCPTINPFTCLKTCKDGYATDEEGCPICRCHQPISKMGTSMQMFLQNKMDKCPEFECKTVCQNGYATNSEGCHICSCKKTERECAHTPMCSEHCPLGFETTEDGCSTCTCKKPKMCTPVNPNTCTKVCPRGYATDIQGCDVCQCKKSVTECARSMVDLQCMLINECPYDLATDMYGCEICQCKMPPLVPKKTVTCSLITPETCSESCDNGYATDDTGCEICKCARPDYECSVMRESTCPIMNKCMYGLATDMRGCRICKCKIPAVCPKMTCTSRCATGFATDDNGCEICQCKRENTDMICQEITSDNCPKTCVHGLATDTNKCETCTCKKPSITYMTVIHQVMQRNILGMSPYMPMEMMSKITTTHTQCQQVSCKMYCQYGFQIDDKTGCETCICKKAPKIGCPAVTYGTVGMCAEFCKNDNECPHDTLCCSNGCGKSCTKATFECVDEHGMSHSEGSLWNRDSCTRCSCVRGNVKCTTMECQPIPEGYKPVFTSGQCCPSYEYETTTCEAREGQKWMDDICTNCTCVDGMARCVAQSCPQIKPGCNPVYKPGQCCPDMECTGCMTDTGKHHEEGQSWNADTCTTCTCVNGNSVCTSMTCQMPEPGCTVIPKDGQCCPTIVCNKKGDVKPCMAAWHSVPTMMLMGNPVPAIGAFVPVCDLNGYFNATQCHAHTGYCWCVDRFGNETPGTRTGNGVPDCETDACMGTNGAMYREGDQWMNNKCTICTCVNGMAKCDDMKCPAVPENCSPIETDDLCCPQYVCNDYCIDVKGTQRNTFEQWNVNSCTQCTCYDENIICRSQQCPKETEDVPEGCYMMPVEGQCCSTKLVCGDVCPYDKPLVQCTVNPCDNAVCHGYANVKCRASYCGGCTAEFYDDLNNKVTCKSTDVCRSDIVKTTKRRTEMIPRCTFDGRYSPKQCDNTGACWCVDRTGEEISHTYDNTGDRVTCEEEPPCRKEQRSIQEQINRGLEVTTDPQCRSNGWYKSEQCDPISNECWCSERDGTEIPGSRKAIRKDLNCGKLALKTSMQYMDIYLV
ncbi:uncharacterized protein LOC100371432 [Saccoglossus kowalevskii]|uniref:Uncharacterized protein LOC100371432 n=1 Tax=Saccoglossus kowalevskii TaxID=10224 RepID=A0ABM0MNR9_SACKO|nr:PREDICTED: uncharacterized protein LOC100371432 [Saccoglossus kowalevskii]